MLAYFGLCVYANIAVFKPMLSVANPPSPDDAKYIVKITATGQALYTNEYEQNDTVYKIYHYWEKVKDRYVYRDIILVLDEKVFGDIAVRRR